MPYIGYCIILMMRVQSLYFLITYSVKWYSNKRKRRVLSENWKTFSIMQKKKCFNSKLPTIQVTFIKRITN